MTSGQSRNNHHPQTANEYIDFVLFLSFGIFFFGNHFHAHSRYTTELIHEFRNIVWWNEFENLSPENTAYLSDVIDWTALHCSPHWSTRVEHCPRIWTIPIPIRTMHAYHFQNHVPFALNFLPNRFQLPQLSYWTLNFRTRHSFNWSSLNHSHSGTCHGVDNHCSTKRDFMKNDDTNNRWRWTD